MKLVFSLLFTSDFVCYKYCFVRFYYVRYIIHLNVIHLQDSEPEFKDNIEDRETEYKRVYAPVDDSSICELHNYTGVYHFVLAHISILCQVCIRHLPKNLHKDA